MVVLYRSKCFKVLLVIYHETNNIFILKVKEWKLTFVGLGGRIMLSTILVCEIQTGEVFTPLNQVPTVTIFCTFAYNTYLYTGRYVYSCFIYIELNRDNGRQTDRLRTFNNYEINHLTYSLINIKSNCPRNLSENLHFKQFFFLIWYWITKKKLQWFLVTVKNKLQTKTTLIYLPNKIFCV